MRVQTREFCYSNGSGGLRGGANRRVCWKVQIEGALTYLIIVSRTRCPRSLSAVVFPLFGNNTHIRCAGTEVEFFVQLEWIRDNLDRLSDQGYGTLLRM